MAYTTYTTILINNADLPQTTTQAGYTSTVSIIQNHITRADAFINGKLARRYDIPFDPTPPLIANISEDITSYYSYRSLYAQDNQNSSTRLAEYQTVDATMTAFALLEQLRLGELDLVNTAGALIPENSDTQDDSVESTNEDYTPIFDVDDTLNQCVDCDRLTDIKNARDC